MLGAIIGDIVGSRFEWDNIKTKEFELFTTECMVTDDTVMTLAIARAILNSREDWSDLGLRAVQAMQALGQLYPDRGYGGMFSTWLGKRHPKPYNSFGNGAAMRVSACGFAARTLEEAKTMSRAVTEVTHNHPEGIKGAEATTVAIWMARNGADKEEIRRVIHEEYYPMDFTLDEIRPTYRFNETCQETVPQALMAFFESTDFEDAIRNAISIGGDSDTLAAITGGVAEAYYGIPEPIARQALGWLDERMTIIYQRFQEFINNKATCP